MAKISQQELDLEGVERGKRRYYRQIRKAMDRGNESATNWGSRMVESAILPYSERLQEIMATDTGVGAVLLRNLGVDLRTSGSAVAPPGAGPASGLERPGD
jgi:hypothetical protein